MPPSPSRLPEERLHVKLVGVSLRKLPPGAKDACLCWSTRQSKRVFGRFSPQVMISFRLAEQQKRLRLASGSNFLNDTPSGERVFWYENDTIRA
jgi:hypothetical protein